MIKTGNSGCGTSTHERNLRKNAGMMNYQFKNRPTDAQLTTVEPTSLVLKGARASHAISPKLVKIHDDPPNDETT